MNNEIHSIWTIKEILDNIIYFIPWSHVYKILSVNKTFKKIGEYNLKKRRKNEYNLWKNQKINYKIKYKYWSDKRNNLTPIKKDNLDKEFYNTWLKFIKYQDRLFIDKLRNIYEKGGGISEEGGFLSDELGGSYNFCDYLVDVLSYLKPTENWLNNQLMLFEIMIDVGDIGWKTHKRYVGNGGCTSVYFILDCIINKFQWIYSDYHYLCKILAYSIFEKIVISCDNINVISFYDLNEIIFQNNNSGNKNIKNKSLLISQEIQMKTIRLICNFYYFKDKLDLNTIYVYSYIHLKGNPLKNIHMFVNTLIFIKENNINYELLRQFKYFIKNIPDEYINKCLNSFFSCKENRKFLMCMLNCNYIRKLLLTYFPNIIFDLCRRRERRILNLFFKTEIDTIRKLKNKNTNETVLYFMLKQRGCTDKIIKNMIKHNLPIK